MLEVSTKKGDFQATFQGGTQNSHFFALFLSCFKLLFCVRLVEVKDKNWENTAKRGREIRDKSKIVYTYVELLARTNCPSVSLHLSFRYGATSDFFHFPNNSETLINKVTRAQKPGLCWSRHTSEKNRSFSLGFSFLYK